MLDTIEINKYWRRVIDTISDALLIISRQGIILAANHSFEEMTGYTPSEITGQSCTILKCDACEKILPGGNGPYCTLYENPGGNIRKCRCEIRRNRQRTPDTSKRPRDVSAVRPSQQLDNPCRRGTPGCGHSRIATG